MHDVEMTGDFEQLSVPFRMQPGLVRMASTEPHWTLLPPDAALRAEKTHLLPHALDDILAVDDTWDPWPAVCAVAHSAAMEHPQALSFDAQVLTLHHLGLRTDCHALGQWERQPDCPAATHALLDALQQRPHWQQVAATLAQVLHEDWAVLTREGQVPQIAAFVPSHWSPREKVGRHFAEIHAPVADNRLIVGAAEALTRLVTSGQRWRRHVWTVTPWPAHDMHPGRTGPVRWPAEADAQALLTHAWWRTERQTFIPVRHTGGDPAHWSLFTIQVRSVPLLSALHQPADAARLADALASMSPAVLAYRGLDKVRDGLVDGLRRLPLGG